MCLASLLSSKFRSCLSCALGIEITILIVNDDKHKLAIDPICHTYHLIILYAGFECTWASVVHSGETRVSCGAWVWFESCKLGSKCQ
jgi:hypothetical protein